MAGAAVITVPAFAGTRSPVHHFFGTRQHSVEHDLAIGIPLQGIQGTALSAWTLSVKQVHGTDALVVDRALSSTDRFMGGWDAVVTNQPGVMVAVRTADCVPILMHDPTHGVVAAIHAGWRGAVGAIVPKTLELLEKRFGSNPHQVRLSIGPSAGVCCYEVDEPVLERLRDGVGSWKQVVQLGRGGKAKLNLKTLIKEQALAYGVSLQAVTIVNLCTICHGDLFFSYRREGKVNGTMISAIGLPLSRR